jgi:hypothetical protein
MLPALSTAEDFADDLRDPLPVTAKNTVSSSTEAMANLEESGCASFSIFTITS